MLCLFYSLYLSGKGKAYSNDAVSTNYRLKMDLLLWFKYVVSFQTTRIGMIIPVVILYQSVASQSLFFWSGLTVLTSWFVLVAFVIECIFREFSKVSWKNIDEVDLVLSILVGLSIIALAATISIDFVPENYTSPVYRTNNVLSAFQCDEIIRISELHAQHNIASLFDEHEGNVSHPKVASAMASGGWLTTRHANYPTTDISAYTIRQNISISSLRNSIPDNEADHLDFVKWLNKTVDATIIPILLKQFNIIQAPTEARLLTMQDLFIVKYDADNSYAQKHLEVHTDSSQLSFNIALSTHQDSKILATDITGDAGGDLSTTQSTAPFDTRYSGGGTYFVRSQSTLHIPKGAMLSHPSRLYHAGNMLTSGKRYILVGFVKVRSDSLTTVYRRFGMFSQCVSMVTADRTDDLNLYTVQSRGPQQCQSYPYVFFYELYTIVTDPFTKARTNHKSFWLASIFTVVLICVFLSLVSVIMLLFSQPDRSEEPTEKEGVTICGHVDSCSADGITKKLK